MYNQPYYAQAGGVQYSYPMYYIPSPETKAEFIRKFVSEKYATNFDVATLLSDATKIWDENVRKMNEKV